MLGIFRDQSERPPSVFFSRCIAYMSWKQELGYEPTNTLATLRKKYTRLALRYHPDKGGNVERMKRLTVAWAAAQVAMQQQAQQRPVPPPYRPQPARQPSYRPQPQPSYRPQPARQPSFRPQPGFGSMNWEPSPPSTPTRPFYGGATPMNWQPSPPSSPRRRSSSYKSGLKNRRRRSSSPYGAMGGMRKSTRRRYA